MNDTNVLGCDHIQFLMSNNSSRTGLVYSAHSAYLKQTFRPRGFSPLSSWGVVRIKYLIKSRKKGEFSRILFSTALRVQSAISAVHFHWSRLTRDHFRILLTLLAYTLHIYTSQSKIGGGRHRNELLPGCAAAVRLVLEHVATTVCMPSFDATDNFLLL